MKLIMENFNKFLAEAENEGGEKPVIKYKIYGDPFDSAEYEYDFDVIENEDNLKSQHETDEKTYISPIQLKNMVKELSELSKEEFEEKLKQKKFELDPVIDFDELRDNVAPTLKKSLPEETTLKNVIDMWAELHDYEIKHP